MRLNDEVRAPMVRLIDEAGEQLGIVAKEQALQGAFDADLDLVEIAPNANPPVCKIMNYGKYLFQENKKLAASKKKQKRIHVKKLRIRPGIEEGDYQVKLRNLIRFLENEDKVEISLRFRGREVTHKEIGLQLLQRMQLDLESYAEVEREPQLQDRQLMMVLVPKKK